MTSDRSRRGQSAEHTGAVRVVKHRLWRPRTILAMTAVAVLAGLAPRASALTITGGPVYTLPGGGSCSLSGTATSASTGGTWTCTGVNTSAHTHVYFGMRVDTNANGNTMTGATPAAGSVFSSVTGTTATSITYDGSTTTVADQVNGTQTVTNQLVLTTGGTNPGTVVATGGTPAGNSNGVIGYLFSLPTGLSSASFTVTGKINASAPTFALQAALTAYDNTHTPASGASDFSKVDLAFYFSDCGDGVVDSPESCDDGANNGTAGSCCTTTCTFKTNGTACTDDGNVCTTDTCNGASATCQHPPGNSGTTCRSAANECDNAELCTGSSSTCPNDTVKASGTACTDDGNVCTTDLCNGTVGSPLCVHNPGNAGTTCRAAASGGCDVAETCTGSSSTCPNDAFQPNTFTCRAAANECDLAENCPGNSATCPADTVKSSST